MARDLLRQFEMATSWPVRKRLVVLRTSVTSRWRVPTLVRWVRAFLPAAVLVVAPVDGPKVEDWEGDCISVNVDEVASGPLSLADAIARAAGGSRVSAGDTPGDRGDDRQQQPAPVSGGDRGQRS